MKRVKFISIEQLLEMKENNDSIKIVEVLSEDNYRQGHIHGAINIPVDRIEKEAGKKLKKTDTIITYCASYACHASTNAAKMLLKMGYKNVLDFKGSKKTWVDAGFKLEK